MRVMGSEAMRVVGRTRRLRVVGRAVMWAADAPPCAPPTTAGRTAGSALGHDVLRVSYAYRATRSVRCRAP